MNDNLLATNKLEYSSLWRVECRADLLGTTLCLVDVDDGAATVDLEEFSKVADCDLPTVNAPSTAPKLAGGQRPSPSEGYFDIGGWVDWMARDCVRISLVVSTIAALAACRTCGLAPSRHFPSPTSINAKALDAATRAPGIRLVDYLVVGRDGHASYRATEARATSSKAGG